MTALPQHVPAVTYHGRRGAVTNAFRYGVDYVLIDPEAAPSGPALFSRNRFNLFAVHDRDHGGPRRAGAGAPWARRILAERGLAAEGVDLRLLTQPRALGYGFNPVTFWLACRGEDLVAVIAEVDNTFGDRHCYVCARPGFAPIGREDRLHAEKVFHVSPFQAIAGGYAFTFDIDPQRIDIRILHHNGEERLAATLSGPRRPLTSRALAAAALRRPLGPLRALALIHWQALRLALKGAPFRSRPAPPAKEIT